jgi:uncharacterized protein
VHRRGGPNGELIVAATDLVGFLECGHLTNLEMQAVAGLIHKPPTDREDPEVKLLQRRGHAHEARYIELLRAGGREVVEADTEWDHSYEDRAEVTKTLMRQGADVIYQATVFDGRWLGFPDFLLRKEGPPPPVSRLYRSEGVRISRPDSNGTGGGDSPRAAVLGTDFHYEVADTKLAHTAKASALIQIASYVEQVARIQGGEPERVYVVTGGAIPEEHAFRTPEMMAYYRHAKQRFEEALARDIDPKATYPDPVEHCSVCKWYSDWCWRTWREDDALPLVAGITRVQRQTLRGLGIETRGALAGATVDSKLEKVREQARLQLQSIQQGKTLYEILDPERDAQGSLVPDRGLSVLPPPNAGDLFFDIEGDPFAFWEGLEYLFGVWESPQGESLWDQDGYRSFWAYDENSRAFTREAEKRAFQDLMDFFSARLAKFPDMHIYHYGAYEPSHLKALVGRHATREEELDQLLRGRVFVDLYRAVRQGVRVGAESYSIKKLEDLYAYKREIDLRDANSSIVEFEQLLEDGDPGGEIKEKIRLYNRDDCISTEKLRDWLELRRVEAARTFGFELPRPPGEIEPPAEEFTARQQAVRDLEQRLTASIPEDAAEQSDADKATWLMSHLLDWHRRENKSAWWRFFELMGLSEDDLVEEPEPIGQLEFQGIVEGGGTKQSYDYRYRFPTQEFKIEVGNEVHDPEITEGETRTGSVVGLDDEARTIDIRRKKGWNGHHPEAIVALNYWGAKAQQDALMRIGEWIADNGMESDSSAYQAGRELLRRMAPRAGQQAGQPLAGAGESGSAAALRLATQLDGTTLPVQGPPGSGKTYSGARMILKLVAAGKKVGIAANSHKVISNLLDAVGDAAVEARMAVRGMQKVDGDDGCKMSFVECVKDNGRVADALAGGMVDVVGGTAWLWSREEMESAIDTLFVDEAGQMSLANVIAMSGCAGNIVLLGDPQQLEQPVQGVHPDGAGASSLGHLLGESETVPPERGLFLERTWRMNPRITEFTSDLFYEGKLLSVPGLERQIVLGDDEFSGSGLRWVPVEHDGNTNESVEEADRVSQIWNALIGRTWVDREGGRRLIRSDDIVIVSPFNAHRLLIQSKLGPTARIGTVDKFQGQEAPISIYTMATSRPEDAPRGMSFLYSLNRLNVATSRAKALAIVVANPRLLDVIPGSPDQLRQANALDTFAEATGASAARNGSPMA